jgi:hypothetical protein
MGDIKVKYWGKNQNNVMRTLPYTSKHGKLKYNTTEFLRYTGRKATTVQFILLLWSLPTDLNVTFRAAGFPACKLTQSRFHCSII